ncbi:hypothetical protein M0R88_17995 [Halorussus gelatinilyticus]|uniref:Uncharacterized protein n=1 Tax=Halorussus gelatinilyticus TaxID=2937524 RepID=A0A8U0IJF0_9EURY|nr:hypothetical protein [Halorussus gelatinilyticus]UPW00384.1 hypothetical protein M0R88_17995 [Halorussus gelatinilyticus]
MVSTPEDPYVPAIHHAGALVESDAPELHEWAESTYADYRAAAREFEPVRSA